VHVRRSVRQLCLNTDKLTATCHDKPPGLSLTYIWIVDCSIRAHISRRELMTIQRELVAAERREVEQKIKALEDWNNLRLENAKRVQMYPYGAKKVLKEMHNPESQLSLWSEDELLSGR